MDPGSDETGAGDLEVVEVEGLGVAGVEVVSHVDGAAQQDQQQHHAYAHARLVGHMHLLNQSQKSVNAVSSISSKSDRPLVTSLTWAAGGGASSGPSRTWMRPLEVRMSPLVMKRSLM